MGYTYSVMEALDAINVLDLHHAYLIEDSADEFLKIQKKLKEAHPEAEVYVREFESLSIDDSRELTHIAGMRSLGTQLLICRAQSCTREAQNALLKLFEEPPSRTHFFICVPNVENMLPTLRSRMWMVSAFATQRIDTAGKQFLKATPRDRIAFIEPIVKEKDVAAASALLKDIETQLYITKQHITHPNSLQHIIDVRRVLHDKGASLKILLESVALTTPRIA